MQFFILLVINIFLWAIFYLFVSLKLERSVSEFREKKLRRLMGEIMTEFNSVAERNISILEHKIKSLKKLLEKSGNMKSVDIVCRDDNQSRLPEIEVNDLSIDEARKDILIEDDKTPFLKRLKEQGNVILGQIRKRFSSAYNNIAGYNNGNIDIKEIGEKDSAPGDITNRKNNDKDLEKDGDISILTRDISKTLADGRTDPENIVSDNSLINAEIKLSNDEILNLFKETDDKYGLIKDLFDKGYDMEFISKCSGIPVGEVKLVLNLQGA